MVRVQEGWGTDAGELNGALPAEDASEVRRAWALELHVRDLDEVLPRPGRILSPTEHLKRNIFPFWKEG